MRKQAKRRANKTKHGCGWRVPDDADYVLITKDGCTVVWDRPKDGWPLEFIVFCMTNELNFGASVTWICGAADFNPDNPQHIVAHLERSKNNV